MSLAALDHPTPRVAPSSFMSSHAMLGALAGLAIGAALVLISLITRAREQTRGAAAAGSREQGGPLSRLRGVLDVCGRREEGFVRREEGFVRGAAWAGSEVGDTAYVAFER